MNGRIDLTRAEGVLEMIEGRSEAAVHLALRQLQGTLFKDLEFAESNITWALAHIEAGIDFSAEGIDTVEHAQLGARLRQTQQQLVTLTNSYKSSRLLKDGIHVAIVGSPNVGKSSLLNTLVGDDRAIVTEIPGTTRDTVEASVVINGAQFVFIDTAGLRATDDQVERMGIEKSKAAIKSADVVVFVFDITKSPNEEELQLLGSVIDKPIIVVANKSDLLSGKEPAPYRALAVLESAAVVEVSTSSGCGLDSLREALFQIVDLGAAEDAAVLTQARQYEALMSAIENLQSSIALVDQGAGGEIIAMELKESLMRVQETIGKRFDDQIMDRVFKEFCIGK